MLPTEHIANLGDALRDAIASHRSRVATIEAERTSETRRLTYGAFGDEAAAYASRLSRSVSAPAIASRSPCRTKRRGSRAPPRRSGSARCSCRSTTSSAPPSKTACCGMPARRS